MAVKIGEIETEITRDVNSVELLKTVLRKYRGEEVVGKVEFKPSELPKKGDKIRITFEKL